MKLLKRMISAAMVLAMTAAVVPVTSSALTIRTDFSFENKFEIGEESADFVNAESAAVYVRERFRTRDTKFVFSLPVSYDYEKAFHDVMLMAVEETYNSDEGDYIKYDINSIYCEGDYDGKKYYYYITMKYYTTSEQELYVNQRVTQVIKSLDLDEKDNYEKIAAIYEYIINNVEYDYSEDESNKERFSAYGALHNGKAVCQGFSQLFYRLAKEAGLPCRIISGMADDGGHAWNIVAIDGIYYLADATWDVFSENISDCNYFMKGTMDFDEYDRAKFHTASGADEDNFIITDFTTDEFKEVYPLAKYAFNAADRQKGYTLGDVNRDGHVDSADASDVLNGYANLTIFGVSRMSAAAELSADINIDKTIDSTDASAILEYYGYASTGGKLSIEDYIKKVK